MTRRTVAIADDARGVLLAGLQHFAHTRFASGSGSYAFVCGSVARGQGTPDSDIDVFLCLDEMSDALHRDFGRLYLRLHRQLGLFPDGEYPGECMSADELDASLRLLEGERPAAVVSRAEVWDAVVWASMLCDAHLAPVGCSTTRARHITHARRALAPWLRHHRCTAAADLTRHVTYRPSSEG